MIKKRLPRILLICLALFTYLATSAHSVPVPPMESHKDFAWEEAWESAWQIAWESAWKSTNIAEFDMDSDMESDFLAQSPTGETIEVKIQEALSPVQFQWGLDVGHMQPQKTSDTDLITADINMPQDSTTSTEQVFTYGKLYVDTTPADASVKLLNMDTPFHQGLDLKPGQYLVQVQKQGMATQVKRVEVLAGMAANVSIALVKSAAKQKTASTDPLVQVEAATSEQLTKSLATPEWIDPLKQNTVVTHNKTRQTTHASINPASSSKAFARVSLRNAPQTNAVGQLYVQTTPANATVKFLDSNLQFSQGMTLAPGSYIVNTSSQGHDSYVKIVKIKKGKATTLAVQLRAQGPSGKLFVKTEPQGAIIRILNIRPKFEQGIELTAGEYSIDATIRGYKTLVQKVRVLPGQDNIITLNLNKKGGKGKLFVKAQPADVTIRILNIRPKFVQGMELDAGEYTLEVSSQGHGKKIKKVSVLSGQDNVVNFGLNEQAKASPTKTLQHQKKVEVEFQAITQLQSTHVAPGRLFVEASPSQARIRILDIKPKFQQGMELTEGTYTIDALLDGYQTVKQTVSVQSGKDTVINLNLEKVAQAPAPAQKTVLAPTAIPELAEATKTKDLNTDSVTTMNTMDTMDAEAFLSMATLAVNSADYAGAIKACDKVLALAPNNVRALKVRGDAFLLMGELNNAVSSYDKAIAIAPEDSQLHQNKAYAEEKLGGKIRKSKQSAQKVVPSPEIVKFALGENLEAPKEN